MNELQNFNFNNLQVRTVLVNDEPWFVGKDVADILGYSNSRKALSDHVDDEDKGVTKSDTLGGNQNITIINESGLYSLILKSKKPEALFADSVSSSENTILIRDLAKIIKQNGIDIGEKRLFTWLRDNGYLVKKIGSDYNSPTQRSMNLGILEFTESTYVHNSGKIIVTKTPKVTGKGQIYFVNKFLQDLAS